MLLIEITVISIFFLRQVSIKNANRIALNITCRLANKTASNSQKPTRRNQNIILRRNKVLIISFE